MIFRQNEQVDFIMKCGLNGFNDMVLDMDFLNGLMWDFR